MNKLLSTALIAVLGIIVYDYHKQADAYKVAVTYLTPIDEDEPDPNLTLYDYLYGRSEAK